jgi:hypothetical protein
MGGAFEPLDEALAGREVAWAVTLGRPERGLALLRMDPALSLADILENRYLRGTVQVALEPPRQVAQDIKPGQRVLLTGRTGPPLTVFSRYSSTPVVVVVRVHAVTSRPLPPFDALTATPERLVDEVFSACAAAPDFELQVTESISGEGGSLVQPSIATLSMAAPDWLDLEHEDAAQARTRLLLRPLRLQQGEEERNGVVELASRRLVVRLRTGTACVGEMLRAFGLRRAPGLLFSPVDVQSGELGRAGVVRAASPQQHPDGPAGSVPG